jgi:uncharacterized protein YjbI with pentapeptide repeats
MTFRAIVAVAILAPATVLACTCSEPDERSFTNADLVIVGRLVSEEWTRVQNGEERTAVLAIERNLKGVVRDRITIRTLIRDDYGHNVCGINIPPAAPVLVHVYRELSGQFRAGRCAFDSESWFDRTKRNRFDRAAGRYRDRLDEIDRSSLPPDQRLAARAAWLDVTGDVERAAAAYTDISRIRDDAMYALRSSSDFFWRQRRIAPRSEQRRAIELTTVDDAVTRSPTDVVPAIVKAIFLEGFDDYEAAVVAYKAVVRLVPDQWFWLVLQARAELQAGQAAAARITIERALTVAPREPMVLSLAALAGVPAASRDSLVRPALRFGWFRSLSAVGMEIDNLDLSYGSIGDGNFILASLDHARFSNMKIDRGGFTGAKLAGADFSNAELESYANFDRANLKGAVFVRARISDGRFNDADLSDVDGRDVTMRAAEFSRARLLNADFTGAALSGAIFREADLQGIRLTRSDLSGATIFATSLRDALFDGADLTGASIDLYRSAGALFEGALYNCETTLYGPRDATPASLGMVSATAECNGEAVRRDYSGRKLSGYYLHFVALAGAVLRDAVFRDVDVACLELSGADLRGAVFSETSVGYCKPERKKLEGAIYDERTKWPGHWAAFDPAAFGMIRQ